MPKVKLMSDETGHLQSGSQSRWICLGKAFLKMTDNQPNFPVVGESELPRVKTAQGSFHSTIAREETPRGQFPHWGCPWM